MGIKVITAPSDPVSLAEARLHLRVTDTSEDALITSLITAARFGQKTKPSVTLISARL